MGGHLAPGEGGLRYGWDFGLMGLAFSSGCIINQGTSEHQGTNDHYCFLQSVFLFFLFFEGRGRQTGSTVRDDRELGYILDSTNY
jgi:hypothetical protein